MSLYLCVFASDEDDDSEVDGIDAGAYDDYHGFRRVVGKLLENGQPGSRFPTLMTSPDSDTEWTPAQCRVLRTELATITEELGRVECGDYDADSWQAQVAAELGLAPRNLAEWFIDLDGESLLTRMDRLASIAVELDRPINFM